ncbi:MAG: TatD family hydrolase [Verrucomicrobiales bacterium]|nr:TatD family hydrolase [Verrucomicrobiales bacterium]
MELTDAHLHLQAPELAPHLAEIWPEMARLGISRAVVNGTCEADWKSVAALAREQAAVIPSFGLHPWHVRKRTDAWLATLEEWLQVFPAAGVGEVGLDRWVKDNDPTEQLPVFQQQLELAARRNRPVTIHCIQAWGLLLEVLRAMPPPRGFLLHAYGGSWEMAQAFAGLGAWFSFSPHFLHERKAAQRDVFRRLPIDRLLLETDAPALWPPPERNRHPLTDPATGTTINHPANLEVTLAGLAELRGLSASDLAAVTEQNFNRWWDAHR